jgi:spermidine/putrescine transport system permease protein
VTRPIVWNGELAPRAALQRRGAALLAPSLLWLLLLLVLPGLVLVALSFASRGDFGRVEWSFTLENFWRLLGFGVYGWSADYLRILGRTLLFAFLTTAGCLVLAYPLAFFIASRRGSRKYLWLALLVVPQCTNLVIRTYAWMLLLAPQSPLSALARAIGLAGPGEALYPGALAVYLGMISASLPFAVLPIYTNVERLDWPLVEAARDLYASNAAIFRHAILPQTLPGLSVAVILTFVPAMGMFVVPDLLGGARTMLLGNLVQQQFGPSRDWPFGAAVCLVLVALTLGGIALLRRAEARRP